MAREEMKVLDIIFWVFAGGVCLWIAGIWISMLLPRFERSRSPRRAASSGGGFADTGFSASMLSHEAASDNAGSESDSGGDSGGGEFSGGGGESGGGGSTGGW